jgi:hypothetical protein
VVNVSHPAIETGIFARHAVEQGLPIRFGWNHLRQDRKDNAWRGRSLTSARARVLRACITVHAVLPAPSVIVSRPSLDRLAIRHFRIAANLAQSLAIGQAISNLVKDFVGECTRSSHRVVSLVQLFVDVAV